MVNHLPSNIFKEGSLIPILHTFNLAKTFGESFVLNIDDSYENRFQFNAMQELDYWGIKPDKINLISSISNSSIESLINSTLYNITEERNVILKSCNCGKLELYGRDIKEGIHGKSKVLENGKCRFCQTAKIIETKQLITTFNHTLRESHNIYPQNMLKTYNSKFPIGMKKEFRISRLRQTQYRIKFNDNFYYLDPDFVGVLSLELLRKDQRLKVCYSQKRPEKLFLLSSLLGNNIDFIGIPYLTNFKEYYEKIKANTNNYKHLIVFIALSTSWNKHENECNETIFKTYKKLSDLNKESLYQKIISSDSLYTYLKTFNNNLLATKY